MSAWRRIRTFLSEWFSGRLWQRDLVRYEHWQDVERRSIAAPPTPAGFVERPPTTPSPIERRAR